MNNFTDFHDLKPNGQLHVDTVQLASQKCEVPQHLLEQNQQHTNSYNSVLNLKYKFRLMCMGGKKTQTTQITTFTSILENNGRFINCSIIFNYQIEMARKLHWRMGNESPGDLQHEMRCAIGKLR